MVLFSLINEKMYTIGVMSKILLCFGSSKRVPCPDIWAGFQAFGSFSKFSNDLKSLGRDISLFLKYFLIQ